MQGDIGEDSVCSTLSPSQHLPQKKSCWEHMTVATRAGQVRASRGSREPNEEASGILGTGKLAGLAVSWAL